MNLIALLRGLFKSIPVGNPVTEIVANIKAKQANQPLPHSWISITAQIVGTGLILYSVLFASGLATTINQAATGTDLKQAVDSVLLVP